MAPRTSAEYQRRLDDALGRALDLPAERRSEFLDEVCAGDEMLRHDVETLLSPPALPDGSRFGRYQIISTLGEGGMGQVYLAQDTQLPRRVALKTLTPQSVQSEEGARRFEKEAWAASSLNHPNVLTIYEVGRLEGRFFIASEFVEGVTVRQKISGPLETATVLDIAIQAAAGLNAAHSAGIVHRDIKPENLMLREDGLLKIVDFGLARIIEENALPRRASAVKTATVPGMVVGTTKYMSPEQARGGAVDGRTDIFSLGAVMYEMLTGKAAFEGETDSDCLAAILLNDPPPLSKTAPDRPAELVRIVNRAMAKDVDARYPSARDLLTDLQALKRDLEVRASAELPAARRKRRVVAATAAACAILAVVAWVFRSKTLTGPSSGHLRSLAVLPFRNLRPDASSDFLGFSLADAVITKFGYISSIAVRPSSAVERYRNRAVDPRSAGHDLDADLILSGNYLKDGDRLRIDIQLTDVAQNRVLWENTLDTRYEDLFAVQDRVAQQIIGQLRLRLSPSEAGNLHFDNPIGREAYEDYLRGVDLYAMNDFAGAIRLLQKSAALEPSYALTWAHLGQAYTTNASLEFGGRDQYRQALAAYEKALSLNPSLIEARVYMANLFTDTGRVEESAPLLRAALVRNPNSADAHWELGYAYRFAGMLPQSVRECERARQIDPEVKLFSSALNSYLYLGEYDRFLASLPQSDTVYILFYRGFGEYYKHDSRAALAHFDRAFALNPSMFQAMLGEALARGLRGDNEGGLRLLRAASTRMEERGVTDPEGYYKLAQAFAVLGDRRAGMKALQETIQGGFFCYPCFQTDPLLDALRNEPGFAQLEDAARVRHEHFQASVDMAKNSGVQ